VELEGAKVPGGFSLIKFADIPNPTAFAFDSHGRLFATSLDGNVYLLTDENKDGRADSQTVYSSGYVQPLGVAVHAPTGDVYISHQGRITIARDMNGDGRADQKRTFVRGLPFKKHQNDNLEFGPDGFLYMGVGSTCDACDDPNGRSATILRFNVTTREIEIYATGLRNPYDIAFHPLTGELFATDNGRDDLGLDGPFEELNHIVQGGNYGYPGCWNEQDAPGCNGTIPAVAFFEAHSSANGLDFYNGVKFPSEYRLNAFVSIFGVGLKSAQTGIQRVILTPVPERDTYRGETEWFVLFPAGHTPLPLLFGPDGGLFVGDYLGNAIYRISYGLP
jgi:glucose/arabinose dehydrogenase